MKNRSELREVIMKVLYQIFIMKEARLSYDLDSIKKDLLEIENEFVNQVTRGVLDHFDFLISFANKYLDGWSMERFNFVDQAIICMGLYELKYTDTPPIVAINEAVELSKKYSDEDMRKLINGLLDKYYHQEIENGK